MKTTIGNPWRLRPVPLLLLGASTLALGLGAAACGESTSDPGQQGTVAEMLIDAIRSGGAGSNVDEGCIRKVSDKLSNESAAAIVAAGEQGASAQDEPGFVAIQDEVLGCIGNG